MEWTSLNDLREKYLSFFESKGHLRLPSFSLIPQGDKSLLLINAGMAPMKKYFTGEVTPPRNRVTTCQKCIRTPDIERVGITARHGTFFEMLGNFSFGDYFKNEATAWAWEFFTKVLEIPEDKLWCSIYEDDDEAFEIWTKKVGVSPDRIVRLGKEDNFWEHGAGPCGPCSEIYFDRGEKYGCGSPDCGVGCDCDRYTEVWNLVFTQFENDGNGNYTKLKSCNIDTGMGLERLACVMQGVDNLFEVDTVKNIMEHIINISGIKYHENEKNDISLRVITDHIRSATFMIGDGVMPSNEGRGYVLRRLLRRAARHGKLLGIEGTFLYKICETVINENRNAYPNLLEKQELIVRVIKSEEEAFHKTVDNGMSLLNALIEKNESGILSGEDAFKLHDTFGFPIDLTKEILSEKNMTVNEKEFRRIYDESRLATRNARKDAGAEAWKGTAAILKDITETKAQCYELTEAESKIIAMIVDGERSEFISSDTEAVIITENTPFYAESGGQVGDSGVIYTNDAEFTVESTTKTPGGIILHKGRITKGESMAVGDIGKLKIDVDRRNKIAKNHTAAHLLQAALRCVLGSHVEQAGQLVNENAVRFDFVHFSALTGEELRAVEKAVNDEILKAYPVVKREMPLEEAKKTGAMALFSEKYGDIVRVVSAGDFSVELCGGTHVDNTGAIGLFKIVSETSVAAGVRRIEAYTGEGVLKYLEESLELLNDTASLVKAVNTSSVPEKVNSLILEMKAKDREIEKLRAEIAGSRLKSIMEKASDLGEIKLISAFVGEATADSLRQMCDLIKSRGEEYIGVLAGEQSEKGTGNICVVCGKKAVSVGAHAGNIARAVAQAAGGNGGGKPDSAMAGAKKPELLPEAVKKAEEIVKAML